MALGKGRIISVRGARLRWVEAGQLHRKSLDYELQLLVQIASGRGQRLVVRLPWGQDHYLQGKPVSRPLLPAWVARCVAAAMDGGYAPEQSAPAMVCTLDALLPNEPWPLTSRELKQTLAAPGCGAILKNSTG